MMRFAEQPGLSVEDTRYVILRLDDMVLFRFSDAGGLLCVCDILKKYNARFMVFAFFDEEQEWFHVDDQGMLPCQL